MYPSLRFIALAFFLLASFNSVCFAAAPADTEMVTTPEGPVFYYTIQKGDTLWDLSRKFYNSEWVWPGLWEMNDEIKNPHWIYPGRKIRIYLADRFTTPVPEPVVPTLPKAEPPPHSPTVSPAPITCRIVVDHLGFIKEEPVPALGYIRQSQASRTILTRGERIYITPEGSTPFVPGRSYQIFSTRSIDQKYGKVRFKGIRHTIKGVITVLSVEDGLVSAEITQSFQPSQPGDPVMAFRSMSEEITIDPRPDPIDARILCSQADNALMARDSIAFINAGQDTMVAPGDIYRIFRTLPEPETTLFSKKKKTLPPAETGSLLVLHVEKTAATVMILAADREVLAGDPVH